MLVLEKGCFIEKYWRLFSFQYLFFNITTDLFVLYYQSSIHITIRSLHSIKTGSEENNKKLLLCLPLVSPHPVTTQRVPAATGVLGKQIGCTKSLYARGLGRCITATSQSWPYGEYFSCNTTLTSANLCTVGSPHSCKHCH